MRGTLGSRILDWLFLRAECLAPWMRTCLFISWWRARWEFRRLLLVFHLLVVILSH